MMFKIASLLLLASAHFASAQNNTTTNSTDVHVLNFALALERLEYAFYRDGLALVEESNTTGLGNDTTTVIKYLTEIRDQEKDHADVLAATITQLGGSPVDECTYDFGYTSVGEFIEIARLLENIGTSAYIGAAYQISNKTLLTVAASIATVEARHAAYLNLVNGVNPFPASFDSPLDIQSVYGLASGYIQNCSSNLSIEARPSLAADSLVVQPGSTLNVTSPGLTGNWTAVQGSWCVFYANSNSTSSKLEWDHDEAPANGANATASYWCRVPEEAHLGDNFLFLSWNATYNITNLAPIIAGPTVVFVEEGEYEALEY